MFHISTVWVYKIAQMLFCISFLFSIGCRKKSPSCNGTSSTGKIIGFDPCRYYTPSNNRKDAGFILEIDNGSTRDTVVTYGIPENIFQFPSVDRDQATIGQFLYPVELQDKYPIRFNYRILADSEKTAVLCRGDINIAPFNRAVKAREIIVSCVTAR